MSSNSVAPINPVIIPNSINDYKSRLTNLTTQMNAIEAKVMKIRSVLFICSFIFETLIILLAGGVGFLQLVLPGDSLTGYISSAFGFLIVVIKSILLYYNVTEKLTNLTSLNQMIRNLLLSINDMQSSVTNNPNFDTVGNQKILESLETNFLFICSSYDNFLSTLIGNSSFQIINSQS
jgi:hypothetical protein